MADRSSRTPGPPGGLLRPSFAAGAHLTAPDLNAEQAQRRQKLRRHNRYLHGEGVLCGLEVVAAEDPSQPWAVWICPGYALGPHGDEIVVAERVILDLHDTTWKKAPASIETVAHVVIRSAEEPARPRPSPWPDSCADEYISTRTAERHEISALWSAPPKPVAGVNLCRPTVHACPACSSSGYLVLASVSLPSEGSTIQPRHIRLRF